MIKFANHPTVESTKGSDGLIDAIQTGRLAISLPEEIQTAIDQGQLTIDLRATPEGVDREKLLTRLYAEVRIEYRPLDVSQEETIYLAKMVSLEGSEAAWDVHITHSIDLDLHSISDKRESSTVRLMLDRELRPVGRATWERLKSFHKRVQ